MSRAFCPTGSRSHQNMEWGEREINVKKTYLVELRRMFSSSGTIVLMAAGSAKCGEEQQGSTVDRNTWLAQPPGQEDFYCKYTLSISKHRTHTLSSGKQQSVPTATERQSPLTTFSCWRFTPAKGRQRQRPCSHTTKHGLIHWQKNKASDSIWPNVYLCLGPSLSLSVDVLIAGLSGVLCGG